MLRPGTAYRHLRLQHAHGCRPYLVNGDALDALAAGTGAHGAQCAALAHRAGVGAVQRNAGRGARPIHGRVGRAEDRNDGRANRCGQVRGAGIVPDIEVAALDHGGELAERGLPDEVQRRVLTQRKFLVASTSWPGGIPAEVQIDGDDPAGVRDPAAVTAIGHGTPVTIGTGSAYERWERVNVVRGVRDGTVSVYAQAHLGDITGDQFRALAALQRDLGSDVRLTNRQNVVFRGLHPDDLPAVYDRLDAIGMARPGAELARDVVACPGSDTCNLAVTQSRGLGDAIGERLEEEGLADVGGIRINISGCPNSCGQHHASDIGFFGAERRAHGRSAPGYQMLLGGYIGQQQMHFGDKALRLPARNAPEATARVIRRFIDERQASEGFRDWMQRAGGARAVAQGLKDLDEFPTYEDDPSFYVDFDEAGPYTVETGASECAT